MAHTRTKIDKNESFNLERVSSVTGNPILDVGYQCSDTRPYFMYSDGYDNVIYSKLHPKSTHNDVIVYSASLAFPNLYYVTDGHNEDIEYYIATPLKNEDIAQRIGVNEVFGVSISYNSENNTSTMLIDTDRDEPYELVCVRNSTGFPCVNVRTFNINPWAKYKPIGFGDYNEIDDSFRYNHMYGLCPIKKEGRNNDYDGFYGYWYRTPDVYQWKRLTDFAGYNKNAKCPIKDIQDIIPKIITKETSRHSGSAIELNPLAIFEDPNDDDVEIKPRVLLRGVGFNDPNVILGLFFNKEGEDINNGVIYTGEQSISSLIGENADINNSQAQQITFDNMPWESGDVLEVRVVAISPSDPSGNARDLKASSISGFLLSFLSVETLSRKRGYAKTKFRGATWDKECVGLNIQESTANIYSNRIESIYLSLRDWHQYREGDIFDGYFKYFVKVGDGDNITSQVFYCSRYHDWSNDFNKWQYGENPEVDGFNFEIPIVLSSPYQINQDNDGFEPIHIYIELYQRILNNDDTYNMVLHGQREEVFSGFICVDFLKPNKLGKIYDTIQYE